MIVFCDKKPNVGPVTFKMLTYSLPITCSYVLKPLEHTVLRSRENWKLMIFFQCAQACEPGYSNTVGECETKCVSLKTKVDY